jgi:hypothetical protein
MPSASGGPLYAHASTLDGTHTGACPPAPPTPVLVLLVADAPPTPVLVLLVADALPTPALVLLVADAPPTPVLVLLATEVPPTPALVLVLTETLSLVPGAFVFPKPPCPSSRPRVDRPQAKTKLKIP